MALQSSGQQARTFRRSRIFTNKGKDIVRKDDLLITLLEKDHILMKYNINKPALKTLIAGIKEDHLSVNNVIDLLKKWNISKADEDVFIRHLTRAANRKNI